MAEGVEGIPGLKQGRDACDIAYHGNGKSLNDAFALGLAVAADAIRKEARNQERQRIEEERCESCEDTGIYTEGDEWMPCDECDLGRDFAERLKSFAAEARQRQSQRTLDPSGEQGEERVDDDWPLEVTLMRESPGRRPLLDANGPFPVGFSKRAESRRYVPATDTSKEEGAVTVTWNRDEALWVGMQIGALTVAEREGLQPPVGGGPSIGFSACAKLRTATATPATDPSKEVQGDGE